eukprot:CAMPEP_0114517330 /NCGR_PEP_ID=MMETSP0109-20121206/17831_1 /TAXON_ID=29199 /ORGANISM="Chlorarachnion reptans, Strain CCCM449" /LENGTH=433 /DNA_ID=CAMNT_0001697833 /DNA_START=260 /DNA_END=1558 /DNA_ORIENTATION=+
MAGSDCSKVNPDFSAMQPDSFQAPAIPPPPPFPVPMNQIIQSSPPPPPPAQLLPALSPSKEEGAQPSSPPTPLLPPPCPFPTLNQSGRAGTDTEKPKSMTWREKAALVKQLIGSSGLQRIQKILGEVAAVTCELRDFLNDRQSHRHNYARIESFLLPTVPSKRALGCQTSVVRHYDPKSKILQAKPGDLVAICASERNRKGVPFFADHHPFRAEIRQIILKFGGKPAVVLDDKTPELPRHPGMRRRRLSTTHHYNGHSNSKKSSDGVTGLRGEVNGSVGDTLSGRGKERELATISDDTKSDKKGLGLTSNKKVNFRRRRSSVSMLKELFEPDGKNVAPIASSLQLNATSIPWIPVRILHRSPGSWSKSEIKRMSVDGQTAKPSESQLWVPRMLLRRITSAPVHHAQPPANCQGCIAIFVETVRSVSKCPELIA